MALSAADWTTYKEYEQTGRASSSVTGDETTALAAIAAEIKAAGGSPVQLLLECFELREAGDTNMTFNSHRFGGRRTA